MLVLSSRIIKARPHEFTGGIIVGKRGAGKSAYSLKVAYEIGRYDGLSNEDAWEFALNSCVFSLEDIINTIKSHNYTNKSKIIIWDDAAVHGNSLQYFVDVFSVSLLKGLMDTVRTSTEALLLTCPSVSTLLKFLRKYDDYYIRVSKHKDWDRRALGYQKITLPSQLQRTKKLWMDEFSCYIPNTYYHRYMDKRDKYKEELIKTLEKRIEKREMKKRLEEMKELAG